MGPELFNSFVGDRDSEMESTLSSCDDNTKLRDVSMLEGRDGTQWDCDRLERRTHVKLMKFNEAKSKIRAIPGTQE